MNKPISEHALDEAYAILEKLTDEELLDAYNRAPIDFKANVYECEIFRMQIVNIFQKRKTYVENRCEGEQAASQGLGTGTE